MGLDSTTVVARDLKHILNVHPVVPLTRGLQPLAYFEDVYLLSMHNGLHLFRVERQQLGVSKLIFPS